MVNDLFRDGFRIIADRLGPDHAIIESTEKGNLEQELIKALYDDENLNSVLSKYVCEFESRAPGLLIMWKHPSRLDHNDPIIHIPFQVLDETYTNSTSLLLDLVAFADRKNDELISKIKEHHKVIKGLSFSINLGIIAVNIEL